MAVKSFRKVETELIGNNGKFTRGKLASNPPFSSLICIAKP
jgi:hypothetical protein